VFIQKNRLKNQFLGLFSVWHAACCTRGMIDGLFASANYEGVKKMLDATVLRHKAISSNIANVETPHYQRIDVNSSFDMELKRAIASNQTGDVNSIQPRIEVDQQAVAQNRDGNSVQLEKELVSMQKNMVAHQLQTQMITGKLSKLRKAISGQA
tara:strand:- start:1754 stop:2215 length:462 start_codon:yes stop_codon:yes gene_type:complete